MKQEISQIDIKREISQIDIKQEISQIDLKQELSQIDIKQESSDELFTRCLVYSVKCFKGFVINTYSYKTRKEDIHFVFYFNIHYLSRFMIWLYILSLTKEV